METKKQRRPTLIITLSIVRNSKRVENTMLRKLDLFPTSSDEGRETPTLLDPLEGANPSHWIQQNRCLPPFTLRWKQVQFPKRCVF
jgi:hypothetical protein